MNLLDDQYKTNARIGLMHNWTFYPADGLKIEFRNFFTSTSQSRVTSREGRDWYNNGRYISAGETKYSNRLIYSGQLGAEKLFNEGKTVIDLPQGTPFHQRMSLISEDTDTSAMIRRYTPFALMFG